MKQLQNLNKLQNNSYFDKLTLGKLLGINPKALDENIRRWVKSGEIIRLKGGLYVNSDYYFKLGEQNKDFLEFIANKLEEPSYLSLEYVLQKYSILTESVFSYTSITLKKTNEFNNNLGLFTYFKFKEDLFTGFKLIEKGDFNIREASKAKALFDYLYIKLRKIPNITIEVVDSFRLNLNEFYLDDFLEFTKYLELLKVKKFQNLNSILIDLKKLND